jgi:hypothetical protein
MNLKVIYTNCDKTQVYLFKRELTTKSVDFWSFKSAEILRRVYW